MSINHPFKWRHFEGSLILLCVRWYLRYGLSYRDLEEMMLDRGLSVAGRATGSEQKWAQCHNLVLLFYPHSLFLLNQII